MQSNFNTTTHEEATTSISSTNFNHHYCYSFFGLLLIRKFWLQPSAIGSNMLVSGELKKPPLCPVFLLVKHMSYLCIRYNHLSHILEKKKKRYWIPKVSFYIPFLKKYHQFLWGFFNYTFHLLYFLGTAPVHTSTQWNTVQPISQSIVYIEMKLSSYFLVQTHRNHIYHFASEAYLSCLSTLNKNSSSEHFFAFGVWPV